MSYRDFIDNVSRPLVTRLYGQIVEEIKDYEGTIDDYDKFLVRISTYDLEYQRDLATEAMLCKAIIKEMKRALNADKRIRKLIREYLVLKGWLGEGKP